MILDVRSILLTTSVVLLILTLMMIIYRVTRKVYAGFTYWIWGNVFTTVGFFLTAMRNVVPDFYSRALGSTFIVFALVIAHQGLRRFLGVFSKDKVIVTIFVFYCLLFGFFFFITDNVAIRIVIFSMSLFLMLFRAGTLFYFKVPEKLNVSAAPGAAVILITCLLLFLRGLYPILNIDTLDVFSSHWINVNGVIMGSVLVFTWTIYFFQLNNSRLELELETAQIELKKLAVTDALTGLYNRRHFFEYAAVAYSRARRHELPLSVLFLDMDLLKEINDNYGHAAGDEALKELANILKENIRVEDNIARLSGDEFAILLFNPDLDYVYNTAERIRKQIETHQFDFEDHKFTFTVSIGYASLKPDDQEFEDMLRRADQALYRAKETGRNIVMG